MQYRPLISRLNKVLASLLVWLSPALALGDADLVLTDGRIYTVDASRSWKQAVAIADGKIVAVGSNAHIQSYVDETTIVIDLEGRMVMPGMVDSHIHAVGPGLDSKRCILPGTFENPDEADMVAAIRACDKRFAGDPVLFGDRYTTSAIPPAKMNRHFLDAIVAERPVVLSDESGHNVLLNTLALGMTELGRDTPNPDGGVIHRDENGDATGYLQSAARMYLGPLRRPEPRPEDYFDALDWSMRELARKGVTAAMEAGVTADSLALWSGVLSQESLVAPHMHLCHWIGNGTQPEPRGADLLAAWDAQGFPDDVRQCAKIYGDNVLEAGTAGLLENYANQDHPGRMNFTQDEFDRIVADLDANGIPIKTHAIGDKTVRTILNSYQKVIEARGSNELRHHVGHITVAHPDDWPRFAQLDVPAEVLGAISALIPYVKVSYYDSLGHERFHERVHAIGAIKRLGGIVNANSDWGAGILDPMRSIQTIITRKDPNSPEVPPAGPQHAVDLPTAIAIHTIDGAYLLNRESSTGSIEVGKEADLIVLDQNLFEIPVDEIRNTQILLTLIGGRTAWKSPSVDWML